MRAHLPRGLLLCLLGGWAALASASEVRVPELVTPVPLGSHQHHLSQTADGRLILSWVETEGKVSRLRFTIRQAGGWITPQTVVTVHNPLAAAPVVLGLSDGALAAAWMVRTGPFGSPVDLYFSRSTDRGHALE